MARLHPKAADLPPSRIFAAPNPEMEAQREKMLNAHWNGQLIRDLAPEEQDVILRLNRWADTDEGKAEAREAAMAAGRFVAPEGYVPASVSPRSPAARPAGFAPEYATRSALQYGDLRLQGKNPLDPFTVARLKWEADNPGFAGHWSNPEVLGRSTVLTDDRQIVYDADGKQITMAGHVLTCEPIEQVQARRVNEARASVDRLRGHNEQYQTQLARNMDADPARVPGLTDHNFGPRAAAAPQGV